MPIYEYVCQQCRADFEKLVPTSTTKVACPACRSRKVARQFSAFALRSNGGATARATASPGAAASCCGGG